MSRRRLAGRKTLPRAKGPWALDSGGFTELSTYGGWTITVERYIREVREYVAMIGKLSWVAQMDWMCEPWILRKTGKTVADHQRLTVENYIDLRTRAPDLPWVPVLQGWTITDYWRHQEQFQRAGIDLAALPVVGVGSVCRRQGTTSAGVILATLASSRLRLHAFGMKVSGLKLSAGSVVSADSLAWSYAARRRPALPECQGGHQSCQNCLLYALRWRARLHQTLDMPDPQEPVIPGPQQGRLF
ncbi:MAG TPA: hypothetical protein VD866_17330 [Urbifossiella sp.]|nr:hypothetical protein [Urbifossiella sp.]